MYDAEDQLPVEEKEDFDIDSKRNELLQDIINGTADDAGEISSRCSEGKNDIVTGSGGSINDGNDIRNEDEANNVFLKL